MTTNETLLVVVLVIALVAFLLRSWFASRGRAQGSGIAHEVLSVWAAQGPFESGDQSAAAMRSAYIDVLGPEGAESFAEAIAKHAVAFDNEPDEWEQVRQEYLEIAEQEQEQKEKEKELDKLATYIAAIIKMHFLNHGDLSDSFKHDRFIVGYIAGVSGCAARVVTGNQEDVGYVSIAVFDRLFAGHGVILAEAMTGWNKSGDKVFKEAALLGMNEFVDAHKIIVMGGEDALEKSMQELRGLEKYLTTL